MSAVIGTAALNFPQLSNDSMTAEAASSYPVQEFRLGIFDTNRNVNLVDGAVTSAKLNGTDTEKWSVNFVSDGVFELMSSNGSTLLTASGTAVTAAADTNAASQRWQIIPVQNDFDGYALYYKVVSNADTSKALTFDPDTNSCGLETYSGADHQKFKLNLDGEEGYSANCMTPSGEKACTIGGLLGETVFVDTVDELKSAIGDTKPKTVVVTADLDMQKEAHTRIRDNKTIIGSYAKNTIYDSYFRTNNEYGTEGDEPSDNIIIKNLHMVAKNVPNRILFNVWSSRQIWIDHINFESLLSYDRTGNGQDEVGKFIWINTPYMTYMDKKDNGRSPDYVTISYCKFTHRYWTVAYGTQNSEITRDRTTLMYNWWNECVRRCPQLGNGSAHVYNNYFSGYDSGNGSGTSQIIGGDGSDMVSESNRFQSFTAAQALCMGGGSEPARDSNSYLSSSSSATPSKISFSPKVTSSWYPNKTNYGYELLDAYNTSGTDTKSFCTKYAGCSSSESGFKYITDADFASWIKTDYDDFFLKDIEVSEGKAAALVNEGERYAFRNVGSGLYLGVENASAANAADVQQLADKQTWSVKASDKGYYYIYSQVGSGSEYLLDVADAKSDNGTNIGIFTNTNCDAQLFKFVSNGDGTFTLATKVSKDKSAVGIVAGSKDAGASAVEWSSDGSDNQKWIIEDSTGTVISGMQVLDTERMQSYSIASDVAVGTEIFGDREGKTFTALADELAGGELIRTACDSKSSTSALARITAASDMDLYVLLDSRVSAAPSWLGGYTAAELTAESGDVKFIVYKKSLSAGESVTLGENGQSSGCWNYCAIAAAAETEIAADLNGDGVFSVADLTALNNWLLGGENSIVNWQAGDLNCDNRLSTFDLILMRKKLFA